MTLEQRVEKLERQNRWFKRGAALVVALAACGTLMAQRKDVGPPDLVVRSLRVQGPETASIRLWNSFGTMRLDVDQGKGKPGVHISAADRGARVYLRCKDGEAQLNCVDVA